jgi:hypothetical protein
MCERVSLSWGSCSVEGVCEAVTGRWRLVVVVTIMMMTSTTMTMLDQGSQTNRSATS